MLLMEHCRLQDDCLVPKEEAMKCAPVALFIALTLTGCAKKVAPMYSGGGAGNPSMSMRLTAFADSGQRYIAERHNLEIVAPETELQKSWESAVAFCGTIRCGIVSSTITARTGDNLPSGTIKLRVIPEDLNKLLAYLEKLGKVAQHTTDREDKTIEVVDTEAKIKNLTTFRDNLRAMLARPSATVKDLVEIQKQLTDTQSELDSQTTLRKILTNETDKIAVEISFRVLRPSGNLGGFALIWDALRESGSTLGDSTASLITTVVAIIPWLILIVPAVWLFVKVWRKWKARRSENAPSPPATTN